MLKNLQSPRIRDRTWLPMIALVCWFTILECSAQTVPFNVQQLLPQLSHHDPKVRAAAAKRAGLIPHKAFVDGLTKCLSDLDSDVRLNAATALRMIPDERVNRIAVESLDHADPAVRIQGCYRLAENPSDTYLPLLAQRLDDIDNEVRLRAASAIRATPGAKADQILLVALKHFDPMVRAQAAIRIMSNPVPQAFDSLAAALSDQDNSVRLNAAQALRVLPGERADELLLRSFQHDDPLVRSQAVLRFVQRPNAKSIDPLIEALSDYHTTVQSYAKQALSKIDDPRAKAALRRGKPREAGNLVAWQKTHASQAPAKFRNLVNQLASFDTNVRRRAAQSITRNKSDEAIKTMLVALDHPDPYIRTYFANHLYSKANPLSVGRLKERLAEIDSEIRLVIARALIRSAGNDATSVAMSMLDHQDAAVRYEATNHFCSKPSEQAIPKLVGLLNDKDSRVRQVSARALARIDGEAATKATLNALLHEDRLVCSELANRFQSKPDPSAVEKLGALIDHIDSSVRIAASRALRVAKGEQATQIAIAVIDHADPIVRANVVTRFYEQPDQRASSKLTVALGDWNLEVQRATAMALGRSGDFVAAEGLYKFILHHDSRLRTDASAALKSINGRAIESKIATDKLPLGPQNAVRWLQAARPMPTPTPESFIEFFGGDRLAGRAVAFEPRSVENGVAFAPYFEVDLLGNEIKSLRNARHIPKDSSRTVGDLRVNTDWIRRIVWHGISNHFRPSTVFLRDGRSISFRSILWEHESVRLLSRSSVYDVAIADLAEIHFTERDVWQCYYEKLALLGYHPEMRVLRFANLDGSNLTSSDRRFFPFYNVQSSDARRWTHVIQPPWSLDAIALDVGVTWLQSDLKPNRVPLIGVVQKDSTRWRVDRNIKGGLLKSALQTYRWGFGVHADNVVSFDLPAIAKAVQTQVGLDRIAGSGGCARGIVRIRSAKNTQPLYESPLLIGSNDVFPSGVLKLPALAEPRRLELIADSAHRQRPKGTDPLNIHDTLDWLEPQVHLDSAELTSRVSAEVSKQVPAWYEWNVRLSPDAIISRSSTWQSSGEFQNSFQPHVVVRNGTLTLQKSIPFGERASRLVIEASRSNESDSNYQIEVKLDGESFGVFELARSTSPNPIVVDVSRFRGRNVVSEIIQSERNDEAVVSWNSIRVISEIESK